MEAGWVIVYPCDSSTVIVEVLNSEKLPERTLKCFNTRYCLYSY